jgi:hypothetical protein
MTRKLIAISVASAIAFGSVSTSAWSASNITNSGQAQGVQTADVSKNQSPLQPGGAAGIKQAQGSGGIPPLTLALITGALVLVWILLGEDNDDDSVPSTAPGN